MAPHPNPTPSRPSDLCSRPATALPDGVDLQDSCNGDSGGPLFVYDTDGCDCEWTEGGANCGTDDGTHCFAMCCNPPATDGTAKYVQVGVVSWGMGDPPCGDDNFPGVYARVAHYATATISAV